MYIFADMYISIHIFPVFLHFRLSLRCFRGSCYIEPPKPRNATDHAFRINLAADTSLFLILAPWHFLFLVD